MKQQLKPNRSICSGDRGIDDLRKIRDIKDRMLNWSDDFLKTIYYNPSSPLWFQAAKETLNERKVPRDKAQPTPKNKKNKKRKFGTQAERDARSTAWKLDRELDDKIKNTP